MLSWYLPGLQGRIVDVYVLKRPFVDHFLRAVGQRYEVRHACRRGLPLVIRGRHAGSG